MALDSDLIWLPEQPNWQEAFAAARVMDGADSHTAIHRLRELANSRLDLARTIKLDRALQSRLLDPRQGTDDPSLIPVKLALLGSSTLTHLVPAIRVAGLRRGLLVQVYEGRYGNWRQELADRDSGVHAFRPQVLLLTLDARQLVELEREGDTGAALRTLRDAWSAAREQLGCTILQQTFLPVFPALLGSAEHELSASPAAIVERMNAALPAASSSAEGVYLVAVHRFAADQGLERWYSPGLWFRARQEIHPAISPLYGDLVARVLAALFGQTAKCLVLDLDQTLWGGMIGEDGVEGIVLGQGSPRGEAHIELQRYALALRDRGIILAVCSKNDESNALLPFEHLPDMLLRREHISCFVANWDDKATNLRRIARELNLGLDALVFVDDNPAERLLVRRQVPEVHVPELPDDPADFVPAISRAGYFEALALTGEDQTRAALYTVRQKGNLEAGDISTPQTRLDDYLASLAMSIEARPFDNAGRQRITQLINKTNQFNLTTRRVLEADVARLASNPRCLTLQLRLRDVHGDHGIIAALAAEPAEDDPDLLQHSGPGELLIIHWVMSCRVFGRKIEHAAMNLLVEQARARGARHLFGLYLPTARNRIVEGFYPKLGFRKLEGAGIGTRWILHLESYNPLPADIVVEAEGAAQFS